MITTKRLHRLCGPAAAGPVAFLVAILLLYIYTVWDNDITWRRKDAALVQQQQEQAANDQIRLDQDAQAQQGLPFSGGSAMGPAAGEPAHKGLREDIHKLLYADDFLPHFQEVLKLPRVTWEDGKASCNWPDLSKIDFQFAGKSDGGWGTNTSWTKTPLPQAELDTERVKWQAQVNSGFMPWKDHAYRFEGRGIVIVGGRGRSIKRIVLILKKLALLSSTLPVELHYYGDEMTDEKRTLLSSLWPKMYYNDLSGAHNIYQTTYGGMVPNQAHYNLKTAAVINSRFAEPLLLDSDNIPALAPDSLWDSDVYKEFGTIFWPDIARTRPDNPIWSITNTKCRMDEYEQESGQLLVDKRRFWYHLQLAAWMNSPVTDAEGNWKSESYYFNILLGDKDTFRFAWHALKTKYGKPAKFLTSVGTLSGPNKFYCGHSFLQYHPDGRPLFMHGGLLKTMQKPVMKWQRENNGGIFQAYKKSDLEEQHDKIVSVHIGWDGMDYFPDKDKYEMEAAWCTFFPDTKARPLEDLIPGFEKDFDAIGGYWPLEEGMPPMKSEVQQ
ncbi:putative alpha-mannosyltransferase, nucleotide-diphospho-sugar transferase [Septoria linicola]|nr:putative alpha-mannosyltransferase, nucleotide-diphospho-sugar transferase [Septoria linicola]